MFENYCIGQSAAKVLSLRIGTTFNDQSKDVHSSEWKWRAPEKGEDMVSTI